MSYEAIEHQITERLAKCDAGFAMYYVPHDVIEAALLVAYKQGCFDGAGEMSELLLESITKQAGGQK